MTTTDRPMTLNWRKSSHTTEEGTVIEADSYDIILYSVNQNWEAKRYNVPTPEEDPDILTFKIQPPRSGLFKVLMRARRVPDQVGYLDAVTKCADTDCLDELAAGVCGSEEWYDNTKPLEDVKKQFENAGEFELCSAWGDSTDPEFGGIRMPETGKLSNRGWIIYGHPAPPSSAGVN